MRSEQETARDTGASRTFRSIFGPRKRSEDAAAAATDAAAERGGVDGMDGDGDGDGDDGMWSDADADADERPAGNNDALEAAAAVRAAGAALAAAAAAAGDGGGLTRASAQGKSMADWAEDEDDEDAWKDALQARVNQLETALRTRAPPPGKRHKPPPSPQNGLRDKRAGATKDFVARNIRAVERRRSASGSGSAASRSDSPAARLRRKGSADSASGSGGTPRSGRGATPRSNGAVFDLSEAEAIRRFVVNDIKQMSMERLVNNAKRLHLLEEFYKHQAPAAAATLSTAAAAPLSPASERSAAGAT